MQNSKGQSLVVLIIIMPIILLMVGFINEMSLISYNKIYLNSLTRTIIANNIDTKEKNDIIKLYSKNNIETDFEIITDNGLEIKFTKKIDSFLGKIINKDSYEIKVDIKGVKENNKIRYEKGTL